MPKTALKLILTTSSALIIGACGAQSAPKTLDTPRDEPKTNAKNVIIFIGDGMGVSTVTAARIFDGQSKGLKGEEHALAFEDFENLALIYQRPA